MPFIYFHCLISLARTSNMLDRGYESRHPSFVPDLRGKNVQPFTIKHDGSCRVVVFLVLGVFLFYKFLLLG